MEDWMEILSSMKVFKGLNDEELIMVREIMEVREFSHNEAIIKMKETGTSMFIIKSGGANVYYKGGSENEFMIRHLEAGELFGEMAIFNDAPRSALVKAFGNTTVFEIPKSKFFNLLEDGFSKETVRNFLLTIIQNLCQRLRFTSNDLFISMDSGRELSQEEIEGLYEELESLHE